jgi:hypothetical protein
MTENNNYEVHIEQEKLWEEAIPAHFRFFATNKNNPADILEVFKFDRTQSEQFLNSLQQGGVQHIEASADNRKLVQQLYFDSQNQVKIKGQNNLAVAYPFFYEKNENTTIFTPLFLFQTELEPEITSVETWRFSTSRARIFPNHYLFNFLENKYGIDKAKIYVELADNQDFTIFLKNTVEYIATKIGFHIEFTANKIFPVQQGEGLENELDDIGIYFNAIIGNFDLPSQFYRPFAFEKNENTVASNFEKYHYGNFQSDVAQFNALAKITEQITVLTGHAGTGKTHTIANLASFALSKGKKILLINNNQKALLQVQNELAKWNIEKFSFVIKNPDADKTVLLDIMRAIGETIDERDKNFNFKNFEVKAEALLFHQEKLRNAYFHLQKEIPVAGNWQNLVGSAMLANQAMGKEIFSAQLKTTNFDFVGEEYYDLSEALRKGKSLYAPLQTLSHPLCNLHHRLFLGTAKDVAFTAVYDKVTVGQYDFLQLYTIGNEIVERFKQKQRNKYQNYQLDLARQAEKLDDLLDENTKLYGTRYSNPGFVQNWFGAFSAKGKLVNEALSSTRSAYDNLAKTYAANKVFAFSFVKDNKIKPLKISALLKDFSLKLKEWDNSSLQRIESEIAILSKNVHEGFGEEIVAFDEKLNALMTDLNQSEIYTAQITVDNTSVVANLKLINTVHDKLNTTEKDLKDFDVFHPWQSFWLTNDAKTKHLIEGAIASKNEAWEAAFDSWYFEQLLQKNYANNLPQHTDIQGDIIKKQNEVVAELSSQISAKGHNQRYELLKNYRRKSERYNAVFGKNNQKLTASMAQLFADDFEALTGCFPFILTTPDHALSLLQKQNFDYIVFDDAQQIEIHQCGNLLQNGKQVILLGDPTEISEKQNSLLYWALQNQFPTAELSMIHTTKSDAMNLFLDAIYPSDSMRLPVLKEKSQFIDIVDVMGRYDEQNNINNTEAEQVLTILNSLEKTNLGKYPSVGIVTATVEQRNLIALILLNLKQKRSVGYDKIMQLERNNLGVYHWSEIEGLKFDIVICSATFGIKDTKGKLSEEIQVLNSTKGFGYLYQTLTRASQKFYLCHSIPYSYFDEFYESHTAKGTFLLSALVKYKSALQNFDYQGQTSILEKVSEGLGSIKNQPKNVFAEEIFAVLQGKITDRALTLMPQIGSLTVPVVIGKKAENEPNIALRIDGTFTLPYTPDSVWEADFEKQLSEANFRVMDTWSASWWRNKEGEIERMLQVLEGVEQEFSPLPPEPEIVEIETEYAVETEVAEEQELAEILDVKEVEKHTIELGKLTQLAENQANTVGENINNESERHHDNFTRPSEA